jgi:hypothetical protein
VKKYIIFDPVTGLNVPCNSAEEARDIQIQKIRSYVLDVMVGTYLCNIETTNEDGTKTWTLFDLELGKEAEQIAKEAARKSIVEFFGVGSLMTYDMVRQVLIEEGLIKEDQVYDIEPGQAN